MRDTRNSHQWGVIAQCRNPYREFHYCPLCRQFKEAATGERLTHKQFRQLLAGLKVTNPMYESDSHVLLEDY